MPTWNAGQYLRFADERTRPCRDLAAAVAVPSPRRIADLGCGPGNSTAVLAARWPAAEITGVDSSEPMLTAARRDLPTRTFVLGDLATWTPEAPVDLLFSNAAMQWVPDHAAVYPRLLAHVAEGGALATQVPCNLDGAAHAAMREVAAQPHFRALLGEELRPWHVHEPGFYYDALVSAATRVDIWTTEYLHVMADAAAIVEWYKGTGLRPYLDRLPDEAERGKFLDAYREAIAAAYPAQGDGKVLFPFRRLFVVAYR